MPIGYSPSLSWLSAILKYKESKDTVQIICINTCVLGRSQSLKQQEQFNSRLSYHSTYKPQAQISHPLVL